MGGDPNYVPEESFPPRYRARLDEERRQIATVILGHLVEASCEPELMARLAARAGGSLDAIRRNLAHGAVVFADALLDELARPRP